MNQLQISTKKSIVFELLKVVFLLLPGYFFGNEFHYLFLIPIVLYLKQTELKSSLIDFRKNPFSQHYLISIWLVLLILIIGFVLKFSQPITICSLRDYYSAFMLLPFLLIIGKNFFTEQTKKIFIAFVLVEIGIGILEYCLSVRTFFFKELIISDFNHDSFYTSRVYGLASNSPIFALRVFIALTFLFQLKIRLRINLILSVLLLIGLTITFNRTILLVFLALVFFTSIKSLVAVLISKKINFKDPLFIQYISIALIVFICIQIPKFKDSFTKGDQTEVTEVPDSWKNSSKPPVYSCSYLNTIAIKEPGELILPEFIKEKLVAAAANINSSGRTIIWMNYLSYIYNHPIKGNRTSKIMLRIDNKKGHFDYLHAHNSFIQYAATNGLILTILVLFLFVFKWKRKNSILILCVVIYSQLQYGILWGISLLDIYFIYLICSTKNSLSFERNRTNSEN